MRVKSGERVGAILGSKGDVIEFLGFGVYVGDEVPPDEGGGSMTGMLNEVGTTNPKIVLDNGDVTWGCECWWGPEASIQNRLAAAKAQEIVVVRMADARKRE
jgi:hypothetical protein